MKVILFVFFTICISLSKQESLKVSVYYESLCPDSQRFILNQLYPSYKKLGRELELDLVPYGKASQENVNGTWTFQCQHGPNECYGNKAQACVLYENAPEKTIDFVNCIMGKPDPSSDTDIKSCANVNGISWNKLQECLIDGRGDKYLSLLGIRTEKVKPKFVPCIWFNDKYDELLDKNAFNNFLNTACGLFTTKPASCKS